MVPYESCFYYAIPSATRDDLWEKNKGMIYRGTVVREESGTDITGPQSEGGPQKAWMKTLVLFANFYIEVIAAIIKLKLAGKIGSKTELGIKKNG